MQLELSFPSVLGYEVIARDAIASFVKQAGFDPQRIDDVRMALGEACINAIEHGNRLQDTLTIDILCGYDGNALRITVYDQGLAPYHPGKKPRTIEEKVAGLGPLRGMGLLLMTELADEAGFVADHSGRNCFQLVWYAKQARRDTPE